mmetsp:Transcript_14311/g.15778  ORF Transcript_14311/g.15778 Transcript_14311/m.15778 type:complete len:83 (-) Transcript_14311:289-537(-)
MHEKLKNEIMWPKCIVPKRGKKKTNNEVKDIIDTEQARRNEKSTGDRVLELRKCFQTNVGYFDFCGRRSPTAKFVQLQNLES